MYRSLGGWTFAFEPYWSEDVCKYLDSPSLVELQELVDPYGKYIKYHVINRRLCVHACMYQLEIVDYMISENTCDLHQLPPPPPSPLNLWLRYDTCMTDVGG